MGPSRSGKRVRVTTVVLWELVGVCIRCESMYLCRTPSVRVSCEFT